MIDMSKSLLFFILGLILYGIGFVNLFWGNDPYFGLTILSISVIFFTPLLFFFYKKNQKAFVYIALCLAVFFIWASLGVGELFEKINLMINSFPETNITGY